MNPYLRCAALLRHEAEQKMLQRQIEALDTQVVERARNEDGTYKADDPSTPDVNEAWVEVEQ